LFTIIKLVPTQSPVLFKQKGGELLIAYYNLSGPYAGRRLIPTIYSTYLT